MENIIVKINEKDNVATAVRKIEKGENVVDGITACDEIPQAHKIALTRIPKGKPVIRYGAVLGYAAYDIPQGSWVNEKSLILPASPSLDHLAYGTQIVNQLPQPPRKTWMGYRNKKGPAGTRNMLGILTSVQCVTGVVQYAIDQIRRELLPKYPHVDDVVMIRHQYGCGVAINAPGAEIPIRIIRNLAHHPNFGGVIMGVGLGCEKLTFDRILDPGEINDNNIIILQNCHGFHEMIDKIVKMAEKKLQILDKRRREEMPLSSLLIGMQCGGSDAFSGISANPSAGYAADMLAEGGGTALFSETTEVRDGVEYIASRCVSQDVCDRLVQEMKWYDNYLAASHVDRSANPTPGNHAGGLTNIVEKSLGSIAKSGTAPINEVLSPGEKPKKKGIIFAATPASDFFCGTSQMASGIGLQVFMTGRGTPYNLAAVPVIKVSSRTDLKDMWPDLIDVNAGVIENGESTVPEVGTALFNLILDVASGKKSAAESLGIHNDLCVFNPAPIT